MVKQYGQLLRETRARLRPTEGELAAQTARELLGRYLFAAVSAVLVFFCTPFELVVRQTLCIVCFAPLSSLAPIYTDRCHGDTALASFTNSVSIAVSLVIMLALGLGFVL